MSFVSRHRNLVRHVGALVLFSIAFVTWFHGIALHPGSRLLCCAGDGTSSIRDFWLSSYLDKSPWSLMHDPLNGAPEGTPRIPSTLLANAGLQTAFVWWSHGLLGTVTAWNLYLLAGVLGTSMATFALLDRLGCSFVASLFGAYAVGFSPYAFTRAYFGHLGLMQNWIFVVAVIAMLHVRSVRTYRSAILAGLAVALGFYISAYEALFAGVIVATFYVVDLIRVPGRGERIRTIALASVSLWTSVVAVVPILALYARERSAFSTAAGRDFGDLYGFAAKMGGYFVPSPTNPLFGWLRGFHPQDLNEQTNFFGYTTLALAIVAVVLAGRKDGWLRGSGARWGTAVSMMLLVAVAFTLSLPPAYHVGGVPIPTPSALLELTTTFWRVYARFGILVGFGLAVLAAMALTALAQRPGRVWRLLGPIALVLLYLEILPGNVGTFATGANAAPPWVSWLAGHPRGIVAAYPMTRGYRTPSQFTLSAFFWQTVDHDPGFVLDNANYPEFLSRQQSIRLLASDLESPLAARVLATKGVRYVVVDPATYRSSNNRPPQLDTRHYTLLARRGGVGIYSVHAPKVDISRAIRANAARLRRLRGLPPLHARPKTAR